MNIDKALESRMLPVERISYLFVYYLFKNIGTRPVFPLLRPQNKSEPFEEETRFPMSWYNLPRAQNFKSRRHEIIPLVPRN